MRRVLKPDIEISGTGAHKSVGLIGNFGAMPKRSRHCIEERRCPVYAESIHGYVTGGASPGKARRSDDSEPGELPV